MGAVPLELEGLGVEQKSGSPVLLLHEPQSDVRIPIWIGQLEAAAIASHLGDDDEPPPPRPLTHDLLLGVITQLGFKVDYVEISDLREGTFYAEIRLVKIGEGEQERITIDSRPSDAVALAVRTECRLMVNEKVLEALKNEELPQSDEEKWDELARSIKPEDFEKFKQ